MDVRELIPHIQARVIKKCDLTPAAGHFILLACQLEASRI